MVHRISSLLDNMEKGSIIKEKKLLESLVDQLHRNVQEWRFGTLEKLFYYFVARYVMVNEHEILIFNNFQVLGSAFTKVGWKLPQDMQ